MTNKAHPQDAPEKSKKELSEMSKTSTTIIERAQKVIIDAVNEVIHAGVVETVSTPNEPDTERFKLSAAYTDAKG